MAADPSSRLDARRSDDGATAVVHLTGEIDLHTVAVLEAAIAEAGADPVLDLSEVTFLDSAGLRVLVAAHDRLGGDGGGLTVRNPSRASRRVLEMTGLVEHLDVEADDRG